MTYWIAGQASSFPAGTIYIGDCQASDRAASNDEVAAWQSAAAAAATNVTTISDRQFFQLLAVQGFITQDEAIAAVSTGAIPSSIAALIAQLPADQQFAAKMKIAGATQFVIGDSAALTLTALYGWTPAQTQAFWNAAAQL